MREHYEERGYVLMRIGRPPKRAFLFRTDEPFNKIAINFVARNGGAAEKLEFLGDGQQVVVAGIHPDTSKPYRLVRRRAGPDRPRGLAVHPRGGSARADRARRRSAGRGSSATSAPPSARGRRRAHRGDGDGAATAPRTGSISSTASAPARRCTTRCATSPPSWSPRAWSRARPSISCARRWRARARRAMSAGASASTKSRAWSIAQRERCAGKTERPAPQPAPRLTPPRSTETLEVFDKWLPLSEQDADLRRARHHRRQPPARRSGLARPDRAAVIRQDRNSQRDRAAAEGGAGRDADGRRAAVGHAEENSTTRARKAGCCARSATSASSC